MTPEAVAEADLLLVRSTVKVDEELLGGSRARFVATATIGTDPRGPATLRGAASPSPTAGPTQTRSRCIAAALLALAGGGLSTRGKDHRRGRSGQRRQARGPKGRGPGHEGPPERPRPWRARPATAASFPLRRSWRRIFSPFTCL